MMSGSIFLFYQRLIGCIDELLVHAKERRQRYGVRTRKFVAGNFGNCVVHRAGERRQRLAHPLRRRPLRNPA